ncbi:nitronate monooxygenase [Solibacillus sp. A46]|uniref:Probable nitronate monooxygenase n=2 Tax=Solibacillus faecavium TaxID=2762221 RepID=A0ABR8XYH7_9BACL|nr:nitronate monooxygenase [Solibacillus faecavium]
MMKSRFSIEKPIIQAPMAGITTPEFVAACCEAGILGSIGAGYLNGDETKGFIQKVKSLTNKPFSVNLFIQEEPGIDVSVLQDAREALQPIYDELGIPKIQRVISTEVFEGQVQAIIDEGVNIVSFTFGIPDEDTIKKLKSHDVYLIGTATTIEEAVEVEKAGLDAVVLQGREAGGHRGTFTEPIELIATADLVKTVQGKVSIPIIAAGGIMTKEHVTSMFDLGASFVQVGTVLLTAHECGAAKTHKNAILNSSQESTTLTKAFTGKYARGLKNKFTEQLKDATVAPYPIQHYLTLHIRKESANQNNPEYMSLWMGENSYLAKEGTIKEIIGHLYL